MLNTLGTIYALHVGMTATLIRVTEERRQMQSQLAMKERMASLGHLVAGILHEVNSPIAAVDSSADVLARCIAKIEEETDACGTIEELKDSTPFQRSLNILKESDRTIQDGIDRIKSSVDSLRQFIRLDEAEFQLTNLNEGLASTLRLLRRQIGDGISVVEDYGDIESTYCSPGQLNQAFMNILQNAVEAIPERGEISVKTYQDESVICVEISDTGVGISPEHLGRVFEVGFSAKDSRVKMGSGLSTAHNIILAHSGVIDIESEVERGTVVKTGLPIQKSDVGSR